MSAEIKSEIVVIRNVREKIKELELKKEETAKKANEFSKKLLAENEEYQAMVAEYQKACDDWHSTIGEFSQLNDAYIDKHGVENE